MSIFMILQAYLGTPALIGLIAGLVFPIVYALRKKFGKQWEAVASYVPALGIDFAPAAMVLSKFLQVLPATLIAAAIGAATSGASLGPTLISASAGPLAALGHELLKALPFVPYRGATAIDLGDKIPGAPKLPTGTGVATMIALCLALSSCVAGQTPPGCTASDIAKIEARSEADYSEKVAIKCAAYSSLAECPAYPDLAAERNVDRKKAEAPCR